MGQNEPKHSTHQDFLLAGGGRRRGVGSCVGILDVDRTGCVVVIKKFHCGVIDDVLMDVEKHKNYYVLVCL